MYKVGLHVGAEPCETIRARVKSIRPDIGTPEADRRHHGSVRRVEIKIAYTVDLIFDRPLDREAGFVGERLWTLSQSIRVSACPRGKIGDLDIGEIGLEIAQDDFQIGLQHLGVLGERAIVIWMYQRFLEPGDLDLRRRDACHNESPIDHAPRRRVWIDPSRSVHVALRAIYNNQLRIFRRISISASPKIQRTLARKFLRRVRHSD